MTADIEHIKRRKDIVTVKYPEQFDPKWVIMESGWPCFRLSALDNQPWKEMHKEREVYQNMLQENHGQLYKVILVSFKTYLVWVI